MATLDRFYFSKSDLSFAEYMTFKGYRFNSAKSFSNVDILVPMYYLFENPSDSGVVILLQERKNKTFDTGLDNFNILWDYDVSTATKTPMPIFNQNNKFRTSNIAKAEVSVLNSVTVPSPDVGDWAVTGAATIADPGIEREPDFIGTAGVGSNTTGDISNDLGLRIYWPGTGFLTRAITTGDDNKHLWGYDWFEIPIEFFGGA